MRKSLCSRCGLENQTHKTPDDCIFALRALVSRYRLALSLMHRYRKSKGKDA